MACRCKKPAVGSDAKFANPLLPELEEAIPKMAEILGVPISDLKVMDAWSFPTSHNYTSYGDHPVATYGLKDGLPFLQAEKMHTKKGLIGFGIILYECRDARNLQYIDYCTKNSDGWRSHFYVCKRGELAKIIRNCRRMQKLATQNVPPILSEGLLEEIIRNSIHFLLNAKLIEKYGVRIRRGILLDGPPGNGKTMACRYIQKLCTDNGINWGIVNASDIEKAFNDNAMEQLFSRYTVTFFDDIDISYLSRKAGKGEIACSILSSMDGMTDTGHTIRIFTTNERIDDLDEAFVRPGRIDRRFLFDKPDASLRARLIASWPQEIIQNIDCERLVDETEDKSFADLEAVRANLVTNFLFGDCTWNLDRALQDFRDGASSFTKPKRKFAGFSQQSKAPTLSIHPAKIV